MLDKDALRFKAKVLRIAQEHFNASCEGGDADPFLNRLYEEFVAEGLKPDFAETWIRRRLEGQFLSVGEAPKWVESEPAWPFLEGKPMVFIAQHCLPRNEVTEHNLTWSEEVYIFGARVNLPRGYRIEYRVVSQFTDDGA